MGSWDNTSGTSNSKAKEEMFVAPPHSLGVPTQKRGGHRSASPKRRVPKLTKEWVATYTLDKYDSDLHMGLDSDSEAEDSDSHKGCSSARGSELMSRSARSYAATYQAVSNQFEQETTLSKRYSQVTMIMHSSLNLLHITLQGSGTRMLPSIDGLNLKLYVILRLPS